ncbi:hypothetical protein RND71_014572 [Anisodus tanguticus]|uniref:Uncharacterized protein n=1 Tax=Anisodus tanguticus TaxID=243964 RepID=A0AAE1SC02_9SOLA|nr:hypothetical protein RND71_014572 [Anisodus tanguticus]
MIGNLEDVAGTTCLLFPELEIERSSLIHCTTSSHPFLETETLNKEGAYSSALPHPLTDNILPLVDDIPCNLQGDKANVHGPN